MSTYKFLQPPHNHDDWDDGGMMAGVVVGVVMVRIS